MAERGCSDSKLGESLSALVFTRPFASVSSSGVGLSAARDGIIKPAVGFQVLSVLLNIVLAPC